MSILNRLEEGLLSQSSGETESIARELAATLPEEAILELRGDLGSGKTTFVKGLAKAWNIQEVVTSPTFNIFNVHEGSRRLLHMDAYRLSSQNNILEELMLEDFAIPPFCLAIEWPSNLPELPWPTTRALTFSIQGNNAREIRLVRSCSGDR